MNPNNVADRINPVPVATRQPNAKQAAGAGGRSRHAGPGGADLLREASRTARRVAAMVLEVLAGARTPTEAAQALELCVARYYQLESRALRGLLSACEPVPKGRVPSPADDLARLRRDKERLQREVLRQQALVRAAQRTVGLAPAPPPSKAGKKSRRRLARALNVAARLHNANPQDAAAEAASPGV